MHYRRLTYADRVKIKVFQKQRKNQSEIAGLLKVHRSTISKELKRNRYKGCYYLKQAQRQVDQRKRSRSFPYKLSPVMWSLITERLYQKWSPEQIKERLNTEGIKVVSVETIYKYIYEDRLRGGSWWTCLRRSHRKRRRRLPQRETRGSLKSVHDISDRPESVEARHNFGHWERDTMLGKHSQSGVLVLTERKSRLNKFIKLENRKAKQVTIKTIDALRKFRCRSITNDRGQEFSDHIECANKMKIKIYFCDPYSAYQRGSNENRIGILRQYLPKQFNPSKLTQKKLNQIEIEINNRPMKLLDWKTPLEVIMEK